jgi:DNA-binding CsgD family transcriptional regulator
LNIYLASLERSYYNPPTEAARSELGEATWEAARTEGKKMSPEQTAEYALKGLETPRTAGAAAEYPADLSAREVEVLRLVAKGMTNVQIATELYVSPRTVNAHLGSVYNKIGSNIRAEAARFAAEHGLL